MHIPTERKPRRSTNLRLNQNQLLIDARGMLLLLLGIKIARGQQNKKRQRRKNHKRPREKAVCPSPAKRHTTFCNALQNAPPKHNKGTTQASGQKESSDASFPVVKNCSSALAWPQTLQASSRCLQICVSPRLNELELLFALGVEIPSPSFAPLAVPPPVPPFPPFPTPFTILPLPSSYR